MNHQEMKESLQLLLYDELSGEERSQVEGHLVACAECRRELESLKKFHTLLNEYSPEPAAERSLGEARQSLQSTLRQGRARRSAWDAIAEFLSPIFAPKVGLAFGAAAMVAVGLGIGYLVFSRTYVTQNLVQPANQLASPTISGETRITNVRFLNSDPSNGQIEFVFDAVKPVKMKGSINDEQIQKVLAHAILNEENPGVRLKSVSAVSSQKTTDRDVKYALISAAKSDENPGVRKEALKALMGLPFDPDIKGAFLFVLAHDKNSGMRIAAINFLDSVKTSATGVDQDFLSILKQKMKSDDNDYIRLRAKAVVEETQQ